MLNKALTSQKYDFTSSRVLPNSRGFYLIHNKSKGLIYAGQSSRLKSRIFHDHLSGNVGGSHFRKSLQEFLGTNREVDISRYIQNQCTFQFLASDTEYKNLEHFAIAMLRPVLNNKAHTRFSDSDVTYPELQSIEAQSKSANSKLQQLLDSQSYSLSDLANKTAAAVHSAAGVYAISSCDDALARFVYVGETESIHKRMRAHMDRLNKLPEAIVNGSKDYILQFMALRDVRERRYLEHYFIAILNPAFNH